MRLVEHQWHAGDLVYKLDSSTNIEQSKKLRSPWMGPCLVVDSRFPLYKIRNQKGDSVIHHDSLKRCNDRDIPIALRRLRHQFFDQDEEQEESSLGYDVLMFDPDETMPYVEAYSDARLLPGYGEDLQEMFQEVGDCDAVSLGTEETSLVEDWDYTSEPVDAVMESTRNVSTRFCPLSSSARSSVNGQGPQALAVPQTGRFTRGGRPVRLPARLQNCKIPGKFYYPTSIFFGCMKM
jgi:hypothetical protein